MNGEHQAGDDIRVHLTVTPERGVPTDGTTSVTAVAHPDGGAPIVLDPEPDGEDRSRWSALLPNAAAGVTAIVWTVTGTGAGVQGFDLAVGPAPGSVTVGRSYATTGQLVDHTGEAPPPGARRLLVRASDRVDELLRTARYDTDVDGHPTDPAILAALVEATCAQAAWFTETGDDGSGIAQHWSDVKIGTVQLSGAGMSSSGEGGGGRYAPGTITALKKVPGLYGAPPEVAW